MTERSRRLTSVLYFVAAALAWAAVGIRYYRSSEVSWLWAAAGLFCVVMGVGALKRDRSGTAEGTRQDRDPRA
jgi:hypothetical protein